MSEGNGYFFDQWYRKHKIDEPTFQSSAAWAHGDEGDGWLWDSLQDQTKKTLCFSVRSRGYMGFFSSLVTWSVAPILVSSPFLVIGNLE